jgi:hypothetical protein
MPVPWPWANRWRRSTERYASISELLPQNPLVEAVAGVVEHDEIDRAVDLDLDADDVVDLDVVGDRADRALLGFEHLDRHLGVVGQEGATPAPGAEGGDRRQREQGRVERQDRAVGGEVEPAGVASSTPSATSSLRRTWPSIEILSFAA